VIPPLPTVGPWLLVFILLAFLMVAGNLYFVVKLFPRDGARPTLATAILLLGLLLMSTGLWLSGIYAVLSPGEASSVSVFLALNSMMAVGGLWAVSLLFRSGTKHLPSRGLPWPATFALLLVGNELLMGLTFVLAQVGPAPYAGQGWLGVAALLGDAAESAWFFWAMLATMTFLVYWLPLARPERMLLYGFAAASAIGPWVVPDPVAGAAGMGVAMGVTFAFVAHELWHQPRPSPRYLWTALGVAVGFLIMVAGEGLSFLMRGSTAASVPYGTASFLVMLVELFLLTRWTWAQGAPAPRETPRRSSPERPAPTAP
jgi:hypothetical protein